GDPAAVHSFPPRRSSDLSTFEGPASRALDCVGNADADVAAVRQCQLLTRSKIVPARCSERFLLGGDIIAAVIDHSCPGSGLEWRSEEHTSELQSRENLVC